jgi:hypothetical protein
LPIILNFDVILPVAVSALAVSIVVYYRLKECKKPKLTNVETRTKYSLPKH